jgi:hypothetical protein
LNEFEYKGKKFKISNNIKQYQPELKKDEDGDMIEWFNMDVIIVFEQFGELYFFDMNIKHIENQHIQPIV